MRLAIAPIIYALIVETGKTATGDLNLDPSMFNPTTPGVLNYYQQRSQKIAEDVNAETEKQLRATISQGIDNDETDIELQARIETVMGSALTYRADRIARTEVTRAQGFADVEAWSQSGVVHGKEWYAILDERTCPWCNSLDGTIVELDTDYLSLGDVLTVDGKSLNISYDNVPTPPAHVSCRCRILPVTVPVDI
ncbi:minor capsid protein [Pseudarthrobacter sp. H2]|uniref:minor capsid protein n=1 Tax=Pseudarthrobacter sp. H2 TaxID=3418415 RepID=UPI003CF4337C